jgi:hypothetical protein
MGDLLARRGASTAAACNKVLRILHAWLEEECEIASSPMAKLRPPIIPSSSPSPSCPRTGCAGCWAPASARASRTAGTPR